MNKSYYEPIVKYHENMSTEELKKLALQLRRDVADLINFAGTRSGQDVYKRQTCDPALKEPADPSGEIPRADKHRHTLPPEICGSDHESGSEGYVYQTFQDLKRSPQISGRRGIYGSGDPDVGEQRGRRGGSAV